MLLEETVELDPKKKAEWEAVSSTLGMTERLVTIIDWEWEFAILTFAGKGSKHYPYQLFDEIICELLLMEAGQSGQQLRELLGLSDELGRKAFTKMIKPLLRDGVVGGDESYFALSEKGKLHAQQGNKFKKNERNFTITVDLQDPHDLQGDTLLKPNPNNRSLEEELEYDRILSTGVRDNLEKQRQYALVQASEIHLPEKGFYLDKAELTQQRGVGMPIRIAIIEDFAQSSHRFRALDFKSGQHLDKISGKLNRRGLAAITDSILLKASEELAPEIIEEEKSATQLADEAWAIQKAKEVSRLSQEGERREKTKNIVAERKSFDAPAFEKELTKLIEQCKGEVWMVSPWVRPRAFQARKKQIQKLLNQGCSVFVGYSEPYRSEEEMLSPETLRQLEDLAETHTRFYHAQLPQFHEKILYVRNPPHFEYEYTGSFNILSLHARNLAQIGRENMRRLQWGPDSQKNYDYLKDRMEGQYLGRLQREVAQIYLDPESKDFYPQLKTMAKKLEDLSGKVKGMIGEERKSQCEEAVQAWKEKLKTWRRSKVELELQHFTTRLDARSEISHAEKKKLENELRQIVAHWPEEIPPKEKAPLLGALLEKNGIWTLNQYLKNLKAVEKELTQKEKASWAEKLQAAEVTYRGAANILTPLFKEARELVREKSQIKGLKEVGRIELPPRKNKKRKKK